ncbi:MAG: hypothetical protein IPJ05_09840 [Nitrosomonas sp.]|nr:hypothetical protein [Nitrosomonas sp.]
MDEPKVDVELLSNETLGFASRLIERRLQEFGVERIKSSLLILAAASFTRYEIEPATGVKKIKSLT